MSGRDWDYREFKTNFLRKTGLDLECYKDQQMERRIRHMIQREKCAGFQDFFLNLSDNHEFMHKFMTYITINTSGFFRDKAVYDTIQDTILPDLKKKFNRLQIWSAGCSNGEEPYTMAIILGEQGMLERSRILAGDFDEKALEKAQEGLYNARQVEKVPSVLLKKCFEQEGDNYRIRERYKKTVSFRRENLLDLKNNTLNKMHLVLCRNVFIYFKTEVQEKIIQFISDLLPEGCYFIIGCAEYINEPANFGLRRLFPAIYIKE